MTKDDLSNKLNRIKLSIEESPLFYSQIKRLWIQINCLEQTVDDIIKKNKNKDGQ